MGIARYHQFEIAVVSVVARNKSGKLIPIVHVVVHSPIKKSEEVLKYFCTLGYFSSRDTRPHK